MRLAIADAVAAGQPSAAALHRDRKMLLASLESAPKASCLEPAAEALTEKTITDRGDLLAELKRIRRQDFALNNQENTTGMMGLAVPIRDREARCCGPRRPRSRGASHHGCRVETS